MSKDLGNGIYAEAIMVHRAEIKAKFVNRYSAILVGGLMMLLPGCASANESGATIDNVLAGYQSAGAVEFSRQRGEALWAKQSVGAEPFSSRSCTSCHGADLKKPGQHVQTKKTIAPMSAAANSQRYQTEADIEKWFLRNCKWTFGRECSAQEKGDFLTYLRMQ